MMTLLTLLLTGIRLFKTYKKIQSWFRLPINQVFNFLLGTLVGALVALLLAPKSGEELRDELRLRPERKMSRLDIEIQQGVQKIKDDAHKLQENLNQTQSETIDSDNSPDDLTRIKGIGPKVSALLGSNGISTFSQLASADVGWMKDLLDGSGYGFIDPSTWGEQAQLASQGKWGELENRQNEL